MKQRKQVSVKQETIDKGNYLSKRKKKTFSAIVDEAIERLFRLQTDISPEGEKDE